MSLQVRVRVDVGQAASVRTTPATREQLDEATELVLEWVAAAEGHGVSYDDLQAVTHVCGAAVDVIKARDR